MIFDKLPQGLKEGSNFCLYKIEPGNGKQKKVPYRTDGARADPGNKAHLTQLINVQTVAQGGGYAGIGKVVDTDEFAIDIDDCVKDGKLNAFAQEIVDKLGTYAELSPSGTGIHIWGRAPNFVFDKTRYYINNRKVGMELYTGSATTRYLTITVKALNSFDMNECSDALHEVMDKYMVIPTADKPTVDAPGSYLTDESVIAKLLSSKNSDKAKELWEGNIPDGKSHSEADMALCSILAFWWGGDAEQMDRIFR